MYLKFKIFIAASNLSLLNQIEREMTMFIIGLPEAYTGSQIIQALSQTQTDKVSVALEEKGYVYKLNSENETETQQRCSHLQAKVFVGQIAVTSMISPMLSDSYYTEIFFNCGTLNPFAAMALQELEKELLNNLTKL